MFYAIVCSLKVHEIHIQRRRIGTGDRYRYYIRANKSKNSGYHEIVSNKHKKKFVVYTNSDGANIIRVAIETIHLNKKK